MLVYYHKLKLTSDAVQIILANTCMNEQLYSGTIKFHKVVQQQIKGEVVGFIPASSAVYTRMQVKKIIEISLHLPNL